MLHKWEHSKLISFMKQMCDCVPILSNKCFISANCYIRHSVCTSMIYQKTPIDHGSDIWSINQSSHTKGKCKSMRSLFTYSTEWRRKYFLSISTISWASSIQCFHLFNYPQQSFSYLGLHHNQRPPVNNNLKILTY